MPTGAAGNAQDRPEVTMTVENPTGDAGASITERIENYLSTPKEPQQYDAEPEAPETQAEELPAGDEPPESDEPQLSLSDIAKYLGVEDNLLDLDEDGSVKVKTKIDGKEGAAKLQDLVKSYQLQGHVDARAREAAEQARTLQDRVSQFEAYAQTEAQKFATLAHIANQELMREVADINWQELARNDPAEYIAKQAEFQGRQARVQQLMAEAQEQQNKFQQVQQYRYQQTIEAEAQRLKTLIPEWSDNTVRESERGELVKWAKGHGLTDADISSLVKADHVAVLRKAWLYDQGKAKANIVEKQVRVAPKLVKPGQSADAVQRQQNSLRDLKDNIRKSGGKRGIAEYLMASGKV
jgi:hypothetical protein